jgi:hypothetical protein
MTTQHLGTFQFLPVIPAGEKLSILIIGDDAGHCTLKSYIDGDKDVWYSEKLDIIVDNERVSEDFPNGFEAVLITF